MPSGGIEASAPSVVNFQSRIAVEGDHHGPRRLAGWLNNSDEGANGEERCSRSRSSPGTTMIQFWSRAKDSGQQQKATTKHCILTASGAMWRALAEIGRDVSARSRQNAVKVHDSLEFPIQVGWIDEGVTDEKSCSASPERAVSEHLGLGPN
ncbi:hypothetical protein B0H13DRAFT_1890000 [Mycena leptocephala]|nr:hypothetical protein B0H13DRAFT_1890000 [Mycena leptocephala]